MIFDEFDIARHIGIKFRPTGHKTGHRRGIYHNIKFVRQNLKFSSKINHYLVDVRNATQLFPIS